MEAKLGTITLELSVEEFKALHKMILENHNHARTVSREESKILSTLNGIDKILVGEL